MSKNKKEKGTYTLADYIKEMDSLGKFANRAGISKSMVVHVMGGGDMCLTIAERIISVSHGYITYESLRKGILSKEDRLNAKKAREEKMKEKEEMK